MLADNGPATTSTARNQGEATVPSRDGTPIAVLPGQQHTAINTAPELFTREVLRFLQV